MSIPADPSAGKEIAQRSPKRNSRQRKNLVMATVTLILIKDIAGLVCAYFSGPSRKRSVGIWSGRSMSYPQLESMIALTNRRDFHSLCPYSTQSDEFKYKDPEMEDCPYCPLHKHIVGNECDDCDLLKRICWLKYKIEKNKQRPDVPVLKHGAQIVDTILREKLSDDFICNGVRFQRHPSGLSVILTRGDVSVTFTRYDRNSNWEIKRKCAESRLLMRLIYSERYISP
jgi:hypothetical protein